MIGAEVGYSGSHQASTRALTYDIELSAGYQGGLWTTRERDLVLGIISEVRRRGAESFVDLACGTGRILEVGVAAGLHAHGVDVSAAMLDACRRRIPGAALSHAHLGDFRPEGPQDLVTLFRFFTNAEPELREEAVATAHRLLVPGGVFVSNVHLQVTSPGGAARQLARAARRAEYPRPYSWRRHRRLLEHAGFVVERIEPYGLLPNIGRIAPRSYSVISSRLERLRCTRFMVDVHDSVIVVARRSA